MDDFSRNTWIFLLKTKSEVQECINFFITWIETQFSTTVKCIRSDQGPEFNCIDFTLSKAHNIKCHVLRLHNKLEW